MTELVTDPRTRAEHEHFIKETRKILKEVVSTENFDAGFEFVNNLNEMNTTFDRAKSLMFDGMDKAWKPEKHEGETFLQAAVRKTGLSPVTIERHSKNQRLLASGEIPDEYYEAIEQAGEKSLVQIANVYESGKEITKKDWRALAEAAGDDRKVGKIVRKIKDVAPRSNFYAISIDEHGILVGHSATEHKEIGKLYVGTGDSFIDKGVYRLTNCSGVLPSVEY
jgi:hypothetical protein